MPDRYNPVHDVRELQGRAGELSRRLERLAETLQTPPATSPDLSDYEAVVLLEGKWYRVAGWVRAPDTPDVRMWLSPIEVPNDDA